jgi:2-dehydro-3-deoxyglucarate aldolase
MDRLKAIKNIRKKLNTNGVSIGSWMQIPHSSIAEIMGQSNYDWIAVDMEHGAISVHQLPDLFRALELGNTLPLVRLAHCHSKDCKQALDAGAGGVIVPMIGSADQLIKVRDSIKWPPSGRRGVAFSRANLFGKNFDEYAEEAKQPLLIAMIEHVDAINELDGILAVDGLDAILIGPYDLSASMNLTAQFEHSKFIKAISDIKKKSERANIPCGVHVVQPSAEVLQQKVDDGYRFIAYSIDSVFLNHVVARPNIIKR